MRKARTTFQTKLLKNKNALLKTMLQLIRLGTAPVGFTYPVYEFPTVTLSPGIGL